MCHHGRGASAAAVVYDITNAESFQKAKHWVSELQKNASGNIVIILVGNKSDLTEQREVTEETGREYAERYGGAFWEMSRPSVHGSSLSIMACGCCRRNSMLFIETSAKTAANVTTIFDTVAEKVTSDGTAQLPAAPVPASA